ncbi:MAG TPA: hypothetical protein VFH80_05790 [Solirubrobacteraceae bacterium]|nr:hypothetical protein [Solirubrobacteraceae bacterium]
MLTWVRRCLTYANVMATLAVFLGLAGGAYAVTNAPASSGTFHGCVDKTTGALRVVQSARSCRPPIRRGGRTVNPGEFAIAWNAQGRPGRQGDQGVQGLQGLQGLPGVPGQNGATNLVIREVMITGLIAGSQSVQCNPGERAVAGGVAPSDFASVDRVFASAPTTAADVTAADGSTPTGWISGIQNTTATDTTFYVVCASP